MCEARAGRSAGGEKVGLLGRKKEERDPPASPERDQARDPRASRCEALRAGGGRGKGDERILGSGDFVNEVLGNSAEEFERSVIRRPSLQELMNKVGKLMGVAIGDL